MILGQDKLLHSIDLYSSENFPRTILLLGEKGCGKHLVSKYIADKLQLEIEDVTSTISFEKILEITLSSTAKIYLIDLSLTTDRLQNVILKFIEEPLEHTYIILLCEDETQLLPTIVNRCVMFKFSNYTKDILRNFTDNEFALNYCATPGQISEYINQDFEALDKLSNLIIDKIHVANYSNLLSIDTKLKYKDEKDKLDADLLLMTLSNKLLERFTNESDIKYLKMHEIISLHRNKLRDTRVNKKYVIDSLLTSLWEYTKDYETRRLKKSN